MGDDEHNEEMFKSQKKTGILRDKDLDRMWSRIDPLVQRRYEEAVYGDNDEEEQDRE